MMRMRMMMMVEVEVVGFWKGVHILLWVQVVLGVEGGRETTGAPRREETKLVVTRRRF